jgi:acyl carrier protein
MELNYGKIMEIKEFIKNFAEAIDADENNLSSETEFTELPIWDSMAVLTVIAMVDEYYGKILSGDEIDGAKTIQGLFNLVAAK